MDSRVKEEIIIQDNPIKHESENVPIGDEVSPPKRQRKSRRTNKPIYAENILEDDSQDGEESDNDPEFNPKKSKKSHTNSPQGFSMFCKEYRSRLQMENPALEGESLDRRLSEWWLSLTVGERQSFSAKKSGMKRRMAKSKQQDVKTEVEPEVEYFAFCCGWDTCDYQYEIVDSCAQHINDEHLVPLQTETDVLRPGTVCKWRGCNRHRRRSMPFVLYDRLVRHVQEEHVLVAKTLKASEISQNYVSHYQDD